MLSYSKDHPQAKCRIGQSSSLLLPFPSRALAPELLRFARSLTKADLSTKAEIPSNSSESNRYLNEGENFLSTEISLQNFTLVYLQEEDA